MNRCLFMPQNWNTNIRTLIVRLTLFYFLFMFPGLVEVIQTVTVTEVILHSMHSNGVNTCISATLLLF